MKVRTTAAALLILIFPAAPTLAADNGMSGMDMPGHKSSQLQAAEGASVKIVTPKTGQEFKGDQVPLEFKLNKGKRGDHVHAYVDGELMGMFSGEKGTLTGIKPGKHTLELRVVSTDHITELKATDRTDFVVK